MKFLGQYSNKKIYSKVKQHWKEILKRRAASPRNKTFQKNLTDNKDTILQRHKTFGSKIFKTEWSFTEKLKLTEKGNLTDKWNDTEIKLYIEIKINRKIKFYIEMKLYRELNPNKTTKIFWEIKHFTEKWNRHRLMKFYRENKTYREINS